MKIAVIHLGFFYAGGGERLVLEEVRGLRQLGHDVECFAPIVDAGACYPELVGEVGVTSLLPRPPPWLPGRVAIAVFLASLLAPIIALRFLRFDVLLAANQPAPWIAWVASRLLRKPYVAYLAQPNRVLYPRPIDLEVNRPNLDYRLAALVARAAKPLIAWADRVSVAGASAVLANGSYMAGVLERVYGRTMISCPAGSHPAPAPGRNGSGPRTGELSIGPLRIREPYVLVTNRHYPQKRFDYALRALTTVPDARLVITGAPTAYTASVKGLIDDLGIQDRVILTGLVSDAELVQLYSHAAVYVYPAPEEDFGMGIVEAMGYGIPTVAWRSAGPTSTVVDGETGFLVEPFDQQAFAASIARLLKDRALATTMGGAGWHRVQNGLAYSSHCMQVEHELTRAAAQAPSAARRTWLRPALQTGFGLLLLALWLRTVPLAEVVKDARPRHLWPLGAIAALAVVSALLRAERWALLLRPHHRVRTRDAFWMNAGGGLLNYVLPVRAGDAARVVWATRRHGLRPGAALATVLADKTSDLAAVCVALLFATAGAVVMGGPSNLKMTAFGAAALAAAGLLAILVVIGIAGPRLASRGRLLPAGWRKSIAAQAVAFTSGIRAAGQPATVWRVAGLSIAALIVDGLAFGLLFQALGISVAPLAAMAAYAALLLTFTLPAAPGYVGSLEVVGSLLLGGGLGLPKAAAAGAIVLWHVVTAAIVLILGLNGLRRLRPVASRRRARRIAVFHCSFTYSGGGERIVLEEVLGLRAQGYEVECFAPTVDANACYPELIRRVEPKTFLPQLPAWMPLREAFQMVTSSLFVPVYAWRFRSFDVFVGANQPGIWIAWYASRLLGKPYLAYLNQPNRLVYPRAIDLETGWQVRPDYHMLSVVIRRIRWFVAWADRRSIVRAQVLLVNGRYIGDVIRRTYRRDAVDCPAGCHVEPSYPVPLDRRFSGEVVINGLLIRKPYVLLTNRHYPQKRFDLAIRAMGAIRREAPSLQLVIPGPATPHTAELRQLVAQLHLEDAIVFTGVVTEAELQRLYAEAAVYVYPAPEEDFGMGVIESMAKGVPVVAWNRAGPTVTVAHGETGYLARVDDVEDYARGILGFITDPRLNQEAGRRAHARAALFSWERHVGILEAAINEVLAGPVAQPAPALEMAEALEAAS
ncbi:MAG TPA: flippase-like domain-containing protein [Candidatus Dormibacteraeota bacterium]|nr:flippase-like domain-containing protein [Candidatus Dormibacteraeota bacterium]